MVVLVIIGIGFIGYRFMTKKNKASSIVSDLNTEVTQQSLVVEGSIPEWLNGSFVRNGPVSVQINDQKIAHWFDGPAMLHGFTFRNGAVSYTNKFLRSKIYEKIFVEGSFNYAGFATKSRFSLWEKIANFFTWNAEPSIQNANVNVGTIANQYVALTETPLPVRFDIKTLDTLGALKFQDDLPKKNIFESAHMHYDMKKQEKINYLIKYGRESKYVFYRYNAEKPYRELIGEVAVDKPAYMHSFALTENYIVLVEFPLTVNPIDLMIMAKPYIKNFSWHPEQGTNFLIIDRKTGKLVNKIKDNDPFFAFHHVNAYEKEGKIVLDIVTYPDADLIVAFGDLNKSYDEENNHINQDAKRTKLMRYTVSPVTEIIDSRVLLDEPIEYPRINEQYNTQPYRYVYAIDPRRLMLSDVQTGVLRPMYKIDTTTGNKVLWQESGVLPGEPVFIPNPHSDKEDEGVVVNIILDVGKQRAFLLILDGQSFKEIARVYAPHAIPLGLHGQFFKLQK